MQVLGAFIQEIIVYVICVWGWFKIFNCTGGESIRGFRKIKKEKFTKPAVLNSERVFLVLSRTVLLQTKISKLPNLDNHSHS